jgi:DNA (cytosine-5)-methyltransferase 1
MTADTRTAHIQPGQILDLFAGAGGWEEALRRLGLSAVGVESDRWACETARAAGHERRLADVTRLDPGEFAPVWGLIGSPPCQAYSTAGKGLGRADRPLVIACARELAAGHDSRAERLRQCRDPRSLLTVEPLRFALALKPRWIALEQVPAVLELWTLFAALLCAHGYRSAAGILSAERYGVPQTRKRAFLIASLDGPVRLPVPTHRSYKPRSRGVPEEELALEPWVSMAEALGWPASREAGCPGCNEAPSDEPGQSCAATCRKRDRGPACNAAAGASRGQGHAGWVWRNGNQPNAALRSERAPAPTIHFDHRANQVEWVPGAYDARQCGARLRPVSEPAPTMLASGLAKGVPLWAAERPATTVACDRRVHPPGHKQNGSDPPGRYEQRRGANAVRVTTTQAAVLQGFDPRYPWRGPRTRQFDQIGNAVPPPLALAVLVEAIRPSAQKPRPSHDNPPPRRQGRAR